MCAIIDYWFNGERREQMNCKYIFMWVARASEWVCVCQHYIMCVHSEWAHTLHHMKYTTHTQPLKYVMLLLLPWYCSTDELLSNQQQLSLAKKWLNVDSAAGEREMHRGVLLCKNRGVLITRWCDINHAFNSLFGSSAQSSPRCMQYRSFIWDLLWESLP